MVNGVVFYLKIQFMEQNLKSLQSSFSNMMFYSAFVPQINKQKKIIFVQN